MISEREAIRMLGEDLVKEYHEMHKVEGLWGSYVSLPLIYQKFGKDLSKLFNKRALFLSHPAYTFYTKETMEIARNKKEELGDYEKEYFGPLMKRIAEAREKGETILVYAPEDKLKETLEIIGPENLILVPTLPSSGFIQEKILGVSGEFLYEFLKVMGVKEGECDGEWKDTCYSTVLDGIKNSGIVVSSNIHYPVRGSYINEVLFYMTEEEEREFVEFCKKFEEWRERKYKEYASRLGIGNDSCEAIIIKEVIESGGVDYLHPWCVEKSCEGKSKKDMKNALKKLERHGIIKTGPATELLDKESLKLYNIFNRIIQEKEGYETDEAILPLIECELLKD